MIFLRRRCGYVLIGASPVVPRVPDEGVSVEGQHLQVGHVGHDVNHLRLGQTVAIQFLRSGEKLMATDNSSSLNSPPPPPYYQDCDGLALPHISHVLCRLELVPRENQRVQVHEVLQALDPTGTFSVVAKNPGLSCVSITC